MMRVISGALVSVLSLVLGCAQADQRPAASSEGSGMTLGQGDTGATTSDDGPTTTVPTTGISASATNGSTDAETAETVTDTQASADDSSTDSTTTGEDSTSEGTSDTNPITASDTDGTTGDETTRGVTTDGDPTDPTNGGCNHPAGAYADCLNHGFAVCNMAQPSCIHDDLNNPTIGVCSIVDCEDVCDCPVAPATGNAPVACSPVLGGGQKACVLACGQQTTCPDGMTCWANTFCVFQ